MGTGSPIRGGPDASELRGLFLTDAGVREQICGGVESAHHENRPHREPSSLLIHDRSRKSMRGAGRRSEAGMRARPLSPGPNDGRGLEPAAALDRLDCRPTSRHPGRSCAAGF